MQEDRLSFWTVQRVGKMQAVFRAALFPALLGLTGRAPTLLGPVTVQRAERAGTACWIDLNNAMTAI